MVTFTKNHHRCNSTGLLGPFTNKLKVCVDFKTLAFLRKTQPQLSEPSIIQTLEPAKVQLKVNILGMISICACAVECSAAIVRYIRTNRLGALK